MVSFTAVAASALLAATALAAPTETKSLAARSNGDITWYYPGLGACGETNGDGDAVAAVSAAIYDAQNVCGRYIKVSYAKGGRKGEATVRVVDRCANCATNDIDLSPSAFEKVTGDKSLGRVSGSWEWAEGTRPRRCLGALESRGSA